MGKILIIAAIAILYSSASAAADKDRAAVVFQYTLATSQVDGFDGAKLAASAGNYGQLTSKTSAFEENSVDDSLQRMRSVLGKNVDLGIAPMFGTDGVFRTRGSQDKSAYVALGFVLDDTATDEEAVTSNIWDEGGLSYGFGVNHSSFNVEYMMHMNDGNDDISAVSLSLTSEF